MRSVGLGRRALWREYLRALGDADPSAFVMENVPVLLRSAEYRRFKDAAEDDLGFRVEGRSSMPPTTASARPADGPS